MGNPISVVHIIHYCAIDKSPIIVTRLYPQPLYVLLVSLLVVDKISNEKF